MPQDHRFGYSDYYSAANQPPIMDAGSRSDNLQKISSVTSNLGLVTIPIKKGGSEGFVDLAKLLADQNEGSLIGSVSNVFAPFIDLIQMYIFLNQKVTILILEQINRLNHQEQSQTVHMPNWRRLLRLIGALI